MGLPLNAAVTDAEIYQAAAGRFHHVDVPANRSELEALVLEERARWIDACVRERRSVETGERLPCGNCGDALPLGSNRACFQCGARGCSTCRPECGHVQGDRGPVVVAGKVAA